MQVRFPRAAMAAMLVTLAWAPAPSLALSFMCTAPNVQQPFPVGVITSYVVPAGTTSVTIDAAGAQGGNSTANGAGVGGRGAEVVANIPVSPGDGLCVLVGARGGNGSLSGSGGGGSFVYRITSGTCASNLASVTTANLLVAAAGGGGGGLSSPNVGNPGRATGLGAGAGGALNGSAGNTGAGGAGLSGGNGGAAGTGGGGGGGLLTDGATSPVPCAGGQALVNGANGGASCVSGTIGAGGFGGGGTAGGGGGYNGGGGASDNPAGAGGGGSFSATAPIAANTLDGVQAGDGAVNICAMVPKVVTPGAAGPNGTIAPSTPQIVPDGGTTSFTITPNVGFTASVAGTCGGSPAGPSATAINYTTSAIAADCSVDPVFTQITYTATPSAGPNGTIAPNTAQTVNHGATTSFTVTPAVGYSATIGGTCGPPAGPSAAPINYTTNAVTANCTVTATFTINSYTVIPSAGANGTIAPNTPQSIAHGSTTSFTGTPNAGYSTVWGGTCPGTPSGNTFNTSAITAACTVNATFTLNSYTVTPSAGANGTITPNTAQTVNHGATRTFTVTPSAGYTASVGGTCPAGTLVGATYTTGAITANCTVVATFALNSYTVTPSAGANGTITPNTPQTVAHGATATFTVMANAGLIATVGGTCGGTLVGTTYTTNAITASCTVAATFAAPGGTSFSGPTATGSGTATAVVTGGGATCGFATAQFIPVSGHAASPPAGTAPGLLFPHGLFDFRLVGCTPGSTVTMTITYPSALPAGTNYWKYGPEPGNATPHWYIIPSAIGATTATFSITDGLQGDDDLAANGTIVDQGGPGVPGGGSASGPQQTPTLSEWALIVLMLLTLGIGTRRLRPRIR